MHMTWALRNAVQEVTTQRVWSCRPSSGVALVVVVGAGPVTQFAGLSARGHWGPLF